MGSSDGVNMKTKDWCNPPTTRGLKRSISQLLLVTAFPGLACAQAGQTDSEAGPAATTAAQSAAASTQPADSLAEVVVTGTRFSGRTVVESPVPIDAISAEELTRGGRSDLVAALKAAVPSLNSPRPSGSAVLDFVEPVTMRGLSPGQVLVLVNGKRRPPIPDLNNANTIGRGDISYSFNNVPPLAIGRLEVLRDGAGAQYGSDAIAGVLNVVLDSSLGGAFKGTASGNYSKFDGERYSDGRDLDVGAAYGFSVLDEGFVRVSAQYRDSGRSSRVRPDTRQQFFGNGGTSPISGNYGSGTGLTPASGTLDPREQTFNRDVWKIGESPFILKSLFVNSEIPVSDNIDFYGFGGYSQTEGDVFAFFRRAGQDETVRALHPNGILPLTRTTFDDYSAVMGLSGGDPATLSWNVASAYSAIEVTGRVFNSNNASMGNDSPTEFDKGGGKSQLWSNTLDFATQFDLGASEPLRVAFGVEYREEVYELIAGEAASYSNGGVPIVDGPSAGRPAPVGVQPAPGVDIVDAGRHQRNSKGAYVEVEQELLDRLTLVGSMRYEDYSDFGDTTDFKVASRLELTDWLSARASFGTGFRAPLLVHSFYSSTTTNFTAGQPVSVRIFQPGDSAAQVIGSEDLRPEEAETLSVGLVLSTGRLTASVDYYNIKIDDRIVISSQFGGAAMTNLLTANGFPGISAATFLTNAVDSTTDGFDVTGNYAFDITDLDTITVALAANFNDTKLDRIAGTPAPLAAIGINTVLFDLTQQVRFTESQPQEKISLSASWDRGPFSLRLTNTYYGETSVVALTNRTPAQIAALTPGYDVSLVPVSATSPNFDIVQTFGAKILTDLEANYEVNHSLTISLGVNNIFDEYPDENIRSTAAGIAAGSNGADNAGTIPFHQISPIGFTGRSAFAALVVKF
jgi:iron complex outermembrane receptor protein